jgi:ribose transport system substrate-binding protein
MGARSKRRFPLPWVSLSTVAAAVLLTSACSSGSGGAVSATAQSCSGAQQAQSAIAAVWHQDESDLGVSQLTPPAQKVCMEQTTRYKKTAPYRIAFASQGPTNSWAVSSDAYVRNVAAKEHATLLYASANGDAATQVNNIQDLLAQNPQALVVQPLGTAIDGELSRVAQAGVPVLVCTGQLPQQNGIVSTVNRSYALQGTLWAQWIAKQIGGKGQVAMLSGIAGVPTAEDEYAGALQVFAKYPGIHLVTHQYTDWSPTQAKQVAATMLVKYPQLSAIWSDSSISDIGVVEAYTAAHKPIPPVTGDSSNGFLRLANQYHVKFALSAYPPEQCGTAINEAVQILQGKPVPNVVPVNSSVYTNANISQYYRPSCSDNLWVPSQLPNNILDELKLC